MNIKGEQKEYLLNIKANPYGMAFFLLGVFEFGHDGQDYQEVLSSANSETLLVVRPVEQIVADGIHCVVVAAGDSYLYHIVAADGLHI